MSYDSNPETHVFLIIAVIFSIYWIVLSLLCIFQADDITWQTSKRFRNEARDSDN